MFETKNGWTKAKMIDAIIQGNLGRVSLSEPLISSSGCAYRAPDGNKCAVGVFIPDDLYNPNMEGCCASALCDNWPSLKTSMPLSSEGLSDMQRVHDTYRKDDDPRPEIIQWIKENVE